MMDCCDGGMMAGMWLFGLLWLLILGGVIWLIARVIMRGGTDDLKGNRSSQDVALDALRNRFASGEIDETEFRKRSEVLRSEDVGHASHG